MRIKLSKIVNLLLNKSLWPLFLILFLGAFLRFYNLRDGMPYLGDEGRDVIIARGIITGEHFPLVGPPTSIGNLYLGPIYFYLMAPFLGLFNFEPLGPAIFVALTSIATIGLLYFLVKEMFKSQLAAVFTALFYAISPLAVEFSRWPWNPNVMPFFATLFFYSLWQTLEKKREHWILLTGVSIALMLQSHYMGLASIPILFVALLIKRPVIKEKTFWLSAIILFLALMSPLLVFDLRHNFLNTRGFWQIVSERERGGFSLLDIFSRERDRIRQIFGDFTTLGERSLANNLLLGLSSVSWIILARQKRRWWLVLIWLFIGALFLSLYQGPFYRHYLEFLLPVCSIFLGGILALLFAQKWWGQGLAILCLLGLSGLFLYQSKIIVTRKLVPGVESTKEIVRFIGTQAGGQPFNFSLLAKNNYDTAYRYFFELWKFPAEYNSVTKQLFVVCEGEELCKPQGNAKWEIAVFDAAYNGKIELVSQWEFLNYFRVFQFKPKT
ncbi:hypothetical protein A2160_03045 [Candidatus Beckwithbacteria bacterium RBG_13_42_9]|uniref:Glycosyltransferase RgtA/B/C/D-like domain-containing protein n=1 Tax=Candidatus Beckwithbacteria bacterium RBG_13_42_9 TaxID=1797457 RepID=A0A1F5E7R9_9BACT|nr:MAG: hypothetical protein A2160_03045 [Candidatus Beckwithbacteria bacterium RBG_13_42_9]